MWHQLTITLKPRRRGFHLVTEELVAPVKGVLAGFSVGMAQFFIQHTSASLSLNENADPSVRTDMEAFFNRLIPGNTPYFTHTYEGDDDMPAHLKQVIIGPSVLVPIHHGALALGTWQGLYLCEHRDQGGPRQIVITLWGEPK
jgi:secondary thiamine-phosphate synthase enzyme